MTSEVETAAAVAEEEEKAPAVVEIDLDDDEGKNGEPNGADIVGVNEADEEQEQAEEEEMEEEACCICQDIVDTLMQGFLPDCDHRFHYKCIVAWAKVTNLCPLCKTKFNEVTRVDANGNVIHREPIADCKQVFRPDPQDHDIAAQLRLVNNARCEICGSGEDEHVLLMCEARGCPISNHTYCIGLSSVPSSSWYCSRHANNHRASDLIERPATTVSSRRRTRRLASLMSSVLSGRRRIANDTSGRGTGRSTRRRRGNNSLAVTNDEERPMRGIAAAYALRMSRELQQIQHRADAMFARGDLTQPGLHTTSRGTLSTRSTLPTPSDTEQMWLDYGTMNIMRQQQAAVAALDIRRPRPVRVSHNFAPSYQELAKLMVDAVGHDNYALSVSLSIPKTAKLRLVSRVKAFFGRLNEREKVAALNMGCLAVLYKWIQPPQQSNGTTSPNPQVLDAVLSVLESLPVRKEDLIEAKGFKEALDEISTQPDVSVELRERSILISEKWREINPPETSNEPSESQIQYPDAASEPTTPQLPTITTFTAHKRSPPQRPTDKKKRKLEPWSSPALEYVKAKLYPLYKEGNGKLTKDRFKAIVKQVLSIFSQEAESVQSQLVTANSELTNFAKNRLMKLIDQVYKASKNGATFSSTLTPASAAAASSYSAVPSSAKHRRIL